MHDVADVFFHRHSDCYTPSHLTKRRVAARHARKDLKTDLKTLRHGAKG